MTFHELNQAVVRSLLESSLHDASLSKQDMSKDLKKVKCLFIKSKDVFECVNCQSVVVVGKTNVLVDSFPRD